MDAPTCGGGWATARAGCCCSATTTRCGRSGRWPPTRSRVDGGVLRGPGCFDMKAGVVLALHAAAALSGGDGLGGPGGPAVTILITGDEELGSPSSRALVEAEAATCVAALVLEASAEGGALKTERKGVSLYQVRVSGRAAHAGLEPERGVNATVELAHQVLAVQALADAALGTTVTPTMLAGGTTSNTVPATGEFSVDVRVRHRGEQDRVDVAMRALRPVLDGAGVAVTGGPNRPPLPASASAALFARAEHAGRPARVAAADGGRGRRGIRRQLHRRRRHADAGRARCGRRRRARRRRARAHRRAARPGGAGGRARRRHPRCVPGGTVGLHQSAHCLWSARTMTNAAEVASMRDVTDPLARPDRPVNGMPAAGVDAAVAAADAAARAAGVRIRELTELDELGDVYRLYDAIWRPDPKNPPVTTELLRALTKAGNYVAGAYDGSELVGACVGFFGAPAGRELHSHIAGVSRAALGRSVGFALKLHQRAWALRHGVATIAWTFDPLVSRNAYFNLAKLAATPAEYLPNFYGGMHDGINGGDETDRLLVRWDLESPSVRAASAGAVQARDAGTERAAGATVGLSAGGGRLAGGRSAGRRHGPGRGAARHRGAPVG